MKTLFCIEENFPEVKKKIDHIIKKLEKLGLSYHFEVIGKSIQEIEVHTTDKTQYIPTEYGIMAPKTTKRKLLVNVIEYMFDMDTLKIGEWEILAKITHEKQENGTYNNVVSFTSGKYTSEYDHTAPNCEHCKSKRFRKITYVLQSDRKTIQIGSTCINDFTGIACEDIVSGYTKVTDIYNEITNKEAYTLRQPQRPIYNTQIALAYAVQETNQNGYSKEKTLSEIVKSMKVSKPLTQEAKDKADEIINLFKPLKTIDEIEQMFGFQNSSFLFNISQAIQGNYCKMSGLIAYAPMAYDKAKETMQRQKDEQEQIDRSEHMFSIGEKIETKLTIDRLTGYPTVYGYTNIVIMSDKNGNVFLWKTSTDNDHIQEGAKLTIKGTVKEHTTYNDIKQTVLTRCKVTN